MPLPELVIKPAFNLTRASHVVLTVADLPRSRAFWVDTLGFMVTAEEGNTLYLRGQEEGCHHSVVIKEDTGPALCERVGFRVYLDEDLDKAAAWFKSKGCKAAFVDVPHQRRTLHVDDIVGTPLEICASMDTQPRLVLAADLAHGAAPQRLDHFQVLAPDVNAACAFYMAMGFRLSEYVAVDGTFDLSGAFLQRKGNPHDVVFVKNRRLGLHHAAFTSPDMAHIMHLCDVLAARGYGSCIEHGPGRHYGPGYAQYIYLRDPDRHRIEFFTNHYQTIDIEDEPIRWDQTRARSIAGWGRPAPDSWRNETSPFA